MKEHEFNEALRPALEERGEVPAEVLAQLKAQIDASTPDSVLDAVMNDPGAIRFLSFCMGLEIPPSMAMPALQAALVMVDVPAARRIHLDRATPLMCESPMATVAAASIYGYAMMTQPPPPELDVAHQGIQLLVFAAVGFLYDSRQASSARG